MLRLLGILAVGILCSLGARATAGEQYFLLMFGSQRIPPNPNYSHTWATFVKATWDGDGPPQQNVRIESHTISWLAANLKIRTNALLPEPGHNFGLHETIEFALCTEQRISLWGAYCIEPELYCRALRRKANLESGEIRYKANDMGYKSDRVTNCIHAVSTIAEGPRLRVASPGWGETASYFVLQKMEPWIISREPVPWVGTALGLDQYPIIYRDYANPRSAAGIGLVMRAFGSERNLRATYGPPMR